MRIHIGHGCYPEMWIPTDLVSSNIKKGFSGHRIATDDDVMNAVDHFLRAKNGTFLHRRDPSVHDRWTKGLNM